MSDSAHHPAAMSPVEQRVAALEALLTERGRRALRVHLGSNVNAELSKLLDAFQEALK